MFVREECKGHKKIALPSFAFMVYFADRFFLDADEVLLASH